MLFEKQKGKLCDWYVQNQSANIVYLGDKSVSASHGIKLASTEDHSDDQSDEEIWAVADTSASAVQLRWTYYDPKTR